MTPCPLLNLQVSWDRKSTAAATAVSSRAVELRCFLRAVAMDWTGRSVAKSESQCMQYKAPHGASLREGRPPHAILGLAFFVVDCPALVLHMGQPALSVSRGQKVM